MSYLVTVNKTYMCRNEEEQRVEFIVANGEINEKGTGFYVLSADRVGRAQWFVKNYPGYPARNPQTEKFSWPFAPAGESETVSTAISMHENEQMKVNEIGKSLNEMDDTIGFMQRADEDN